MSDEDITKRLVEAETALAKAVQRLRKLQRDVLYGQYSAAEFDDAVNAYRTTRSAAYEIRNEYAKARSQLESGQPPQPEPAQRPEPTVQAEDVAIFVPTPHMRFIRWLHRTGRMSEWPDEIVKTHSG